VSVCVRAGVLLIPRAWSGRSGLETELRGYAGCCPAVGWAGGAALLAPLHFNPQHDERSAELATGITHVHTTRAWALCAHTHARCAVRRARQFSPLPCLMRCSRRCGVGVGCSWGGPDCVRSHAARTVDSLRALVCRPAGVCTVGGGQRAEGAFQGWWRGAGRLLLACCTVAWCGLRGAHTLGSAWPV
jgi:hypothetical protein